MNQITYIALTDGYVERVTSNDVDPAEMAGVIDRSIEPVRVGGPGWALNRKSGYTCTGEIGSKRATFTLLDEGVPIAVLAICMHSRASTPLWNWLHDNATRSLPDMNGPPAAPWVAMRYDVPEEILPDWIDWWAKTVGWALITGPAQ
ncbi:MAG: hypothetical protein V4713_12155 [Pseudomonadota bacterium]